ncbi:hypothetical protein BH09BAC1_BH09BAC1_16590 [soil metagenome]
MFLNGRQNDFPRNTFHCETIYCNWLANYKKTPSKGLR